VVDDEPIVRNLLAKILTKDGHAVVACAGAEEAARAVEARGFGVIIADVTMLQQRGGAAFRGLCRRRPELLGKLVFITGRLDASTEPTELAVRNPVLFKPFTSDQVRHSVRSVLRRQANAPDAGGPAEPGQ
jgi:DNA-binding NtrC family response regulator